MGMRSISAEIARFAEPRRGVSLSARQTRFCSGCYFLNSYLAVGDTPLLALRGRMKTPNPQSPNLPSLFS